MTDGSGTELLKKKTSKEPNSPAYETYYITDLKPGDERTVNFEYTVPTKALTLTAAINVDMPPILNICGESTFADNLVSITPAMDLQNLTAQITSYPESAPAGYSVSVAGQLTGEGDVPINTTVKWSVNGNTVYQGPVTVDRTKDLNLPLSMPATDTTVGLEVNPDRSQPPDESTWADNRDSVTIKLEAAPPPSGGGDLTLTPDPAKWWEMVTARLEPPKPTPPRGKLTGWSITSAKLTYPKKHPDWTFGHPLDPVGTTTVNMSTGGRTASVDIRQDWSNYGSDVYDIIAGRHIPGPTHYPITANYTIRYTYEYRVCRTDSEGNRKCRTVKKTGTKSGDVSANLLVDGTSVLPRAH